MFSLGLKELHDPRRHLFAKMTVDAAVAAHLPASVDYLAQYPQPDDQGPFGTCVAFGNRKMFEFFFKKRKGHSITISPRALFSAIKTKFYPGDPGDNGAQVSDGLTILEDFYALESDMPYEPNATFDQFLHSVPANIEHKDFEFKNFVAVPTDVAHFKYALFKHGPVVIGTSWAQEWFGTALDGNMQSTNLTSAGGHCIALIGYNDHHVNADGTHGAFLMINNWNTSWAKGGYAYLPYNVDPAFFPTDAFTAVA